MENCQDCNNPYEFTVDPSLDSGGTGNTSYQIPTTASGDYSNIQYIVTEDTTTGDMTVITEGINIWDDPGFLLEFGNSNIHRIRIYASDVWGDISNSYYVEHGVDDTYKLIEVLDEGSWYN